MRLIPVGSLQAGMKLGKKIYNEDGVVLLSENAELTDAIIRRLKSHGLDFVYIADPRTDDVVVNDMIEDETRRHALSEIRTQFRNWATPAVKGVVYPYLGKKFTGVIESILDDLSARNDAMIMMMNINSMDHYLYRHSLNVCVYTLLLGQIHGYSKDELTMLGLGAMLHDVGKTKLPLSLLNKPSRLTDEEFKQIQLHPELGFKMLKDEPGIPLISAHCAYQHHEKIDGSGYPRGLRGEEIHEFARWIAITDAYDAMTTHRVYRKAMLPHQALEVLYAGCGDWYEKSKLEVFRDRVAIYPLGMTVKLSTGESGVVVKINGHMPQRPVVRVLTDPLGAELKSPFEIDLSVQFAVVITEIDGMGMVIKS
ncbi:MAG: HD-GYP domain-containing protein [Paenibacillus macerans]|uniref:HD domain protein n=1 Tax=Paenibacillus macerans TaxID=44252 RepID=A0A090YL66_PAEMA|nr:HD-GYP domain-containing protein [Paenibacillus macerans]KFM92920.1 HD domain protein [Paenibacillus macerans]MBS5913407.1 HD-GYP domain-containing protein [Paenibacillus macerans]MCY7557353.1 HD-GYP domain-containing protein [Paenibacillus macerans]MDU5946493.1 HD-GYP domain-containing protein [Paenibacillus macerans]MDU7477504.1 HD-GYP domain-containing protein [Paenibacillus macerans]